MLKDMKAYGHMKPGQKAQAEDPLPGHGPGCRCRAVHRNGAPGEAESRRGALES